MRSSVTPGQAANEVAIQVGSNTISNTIPVGVNPVYGVMSLDDNRVFILNAGQQKRSVTTQYEPAGRYAHREPHPCGWRAGMGRPASAGNLCWVTANSTEQCFDHQHPALLHRGVAEQSQLHRSQPDGCVHLWHEVYCARGQQSAGGHRSGGWNASLRGELQCHERQPVFDRFGTANITGFRSPAMWRPSTR